MTRRYYDWLFLLAVVALLIAGPGFAQNATPPTGGGSPWDSLANIIASIDPTTLCLGVGAAIAFGVKFLKRLPVVEKFPKATAFVLSGVVALVQHFSFNPHGKFGPILTCVLTQLVGAIGTHEMVLSKESFPARVVQAAKSDTPLSSPPRT